jgi:hypothetical protein
MTPSQAQELTQLFNEAIEATRDYYIATSSSHSSQTLLLTLRVNKDVALYAFNSHVMLLTKTNEG